LWQFRRTKASFLILPGKKDCTALAALECQSNAPAPSRNRLCYDLLANFTKISLFMPEQKAYVKNRIKTAI